MADKYQPMSFQAMGVIDNLLLALSVNVDPLFPVPLNHQFIVNTNKANSFQTKNQSNQKIF